MTKQQETIREMASKKLLNGEQKKTLYKLFEAKIDKCLRNFGKKRSDEHEKLEKKILDTARKSPAIKKILEQYEKSKKFIREFREAIEKAGFDLSNDRIDDKEAVDLKLYSYHSDNKELKEFDQLTCDKEEQIRELKLKLLADIYGLPLSYPEMNDYIDREFAKIETS